MAVGNLITQSCTILRRSSGEIDAYGNETTVTAQLQTVCALQQTSSSEQDNMGEVSSADYHLFLNSGEAIGTGDAVQVGSATYELIGAPWVAFNPRTGSESHIEAKVRIVEGAQ